MPAPRGNKNNPKGRPAGTPNKITTDLRQEIKSFLDRNWPQVQEDFQRIDPEARLAFIEKMMKYAVPSLSSVAVDASVELKNEQNRIRSLFEPLQDEADPGK